MSGTLFWGLSATSLPAEEIPACALSGSPTMTIGGKPALRLSDVKNCPPELVEIIDGIMLDGQPMVHVRPGGTVETTCVTKADPTVSLSGKPAQGTGDVLCKTQ